MEKETQELKNFNWMPKNTKFRSRYDIGDKVTLNFYKAGALEGCEIYGVQFDAEKVYYDVDVLVKVEGEENYKTILRNVDSAFVKDA